MSLLELEWWAYLFIVFSFFMFCLALNYVVKKFNEAKIEERFIRMLNKASTTQSTQVNGPLIAMETGKRMQSNSKIILPTPPGISLVFNKEENKRQNDLEDTFNIIKKTLEIKKLDVLSLNTNRSLETIEVMPFRQSDRKITVSVPLKMADSDPGPTDKNTPNKTNRVLVKKNEFGQITKDTASNDQSDCYVTEVVSIQQNEFGFFLPKTSASTIKLDYNVNELIKVKDSAHVISKEISPDIGSTNNSDIFLNKFDSLKIPEPTEAKISASNNSNTEHVTINRNGSTTGIAIPNVTEGNRNDAYATGTISKTNENIDANKIIKRTVGMIMSKISDKIINRTSNPQYERKSMSDSISANETPLTPNTDTGSDTNAIKTNLVEKKEFVRIVPEDPISSQARINLNNSNKPESGGAIVKATSYRNSNQNVTESTSKDKDNESKPSDTRETSSNAQTTSTEPQFTNVEPIHNATTPNNEETPSSPTRSIKEIVSARKSVSTNESKYFEAQETISNEQNESIVNASERVVPKSNVDNISPRNSKVIRIVGSSNVDIKSDNFWATDESSVSCEAADTSTQADKAANETSHKKKRFRDKIKSLLWPPVMNEDTMVLKPSSSKKK